EENDRLGRFAPLGLLGQQVANRRQPTERAQAGQSKEVASIGEERRWCHENATRNEWEKRCCQHSENPYLLQGYSVSAALTSGWHAERRRDPLPSAAPALTMMEEGWRRRGRTAAAPAAGTRRPNMRAMRFLRWPLLLLPLALAGAGRSAEQA